MFNIRVYGLISCENCLLILNEPFAGVLVNKFPGGGLEEGEGTVDCLIREVKEELNLEITNIAHFYTFDKYAPSMQNKGQFLPIYYTAEVKNKNELLLLDPDIEKVAWVDKNHLKPTDVDLPIDQEVLKIYQEKKGLTEL